ncbi:MAG: FecR domain-containing protein [Puniceicoccales bacterium]
MNCRPAYLLFALLVLAPFASLQGQEAAMKPASILVARVSGNVTISDVATAEFRPLTKGMKIGQGVTINTGPDGSAILLFSNGSTLTVKPDTKLGIDEYMQSKTEKRTPDELKQLDKEPSTSKTKLRLLEGDLVGSVKKLDIDNGSSFQIDSPIGTAGIRGTTWSMSVRITQDGATGRFGIAIGNGIFIPLSGAEQSVGSDVEVTITANLNDSGELVITEVTSNEMSTELNEEITITTDEAVEDFEEFSGQEFDSDNDVGGENDQQQTENRQRAEPNEPADRVTPTQGEGSSTSGQ